MSLHETGPAGKPGLIVPTRDDGNQTSGRELSRLTWLAGGVVVIMVLTVVGLIVGYWREIGRGRARVEVAARQISDSWNSTYQRAATSRVTRSVTPVFELGLSQGERNPARMTRAMQSGGQAVPAQCDCSRLIPLYSYWFDPGTGQLEAAGDTAGQPVLARARQVSRNAFLMTVDPSADFGFRGRDAAGPWISYFRVLAGPGGNAVLGFVFRLTALDTGMLRPPWERLLALNWPDSATRATALRIEVGILDSILFRDGEQFVSNYAAAGPYPDGFRILHATTWLNPAALVSVTPGGLPRVPVLMFALLLVLTVLMGATALLLLGRTARLARLREDFASSISHELRTPLTQILLVAETLDLNRPALETREAAATIIVREARRLLHLVENVLKFAAGQRNGGSIDLSYRRLAPLIAESAAGMQLIGDTHSARIVTDLDEDAAALADADAIRSIVTCLIDNALRYGPAGQTVCVRLRRAAGRVLLEVDDEGPGIPAAMRDAVWQPFERGARRGPGTGIGLAIVRQLVVRHGGSCHIEATAQGGARVVIELPAANLPAAQESAAPA